MKRLLLIIAIAFGGYTTYVHFRPPNSVTPVVQAREAKSIPADSDSILANAFRDHLSNIDVQGQGRVLKVLPDDNDGIRHQRFIVRLDSGQTVLIAHNIDLASRISSLSEGDTVEFKGQYEWNSKGGVIHWTHRDPSGRHQAGWLKHQGQLIQ